MNPFVAARESALALRAQILRRRESDPVLSSDVISSCLAHHGLRSISVAADSPRLNMADATLFRSLQVIFVRNDKSEGETNFILGHEIGHVEMHQDDMATHQATRKTQDVSARSAGGTQYVEAYGARERVDDATAQQRDVARIFCAYEEALVRDKTLDFTALVQWPAAALQREPERFRAIIRLTS